MTEKRQCDSCGVNGTSKTIHGLRTVKGTDDGMTFLCRRCWNNTMTWRKAQNTRLSKSNRFPIRSWRKS